MDLHFNTESYFTRWIVDSGLLYTPFVIVDVGVQGGENPRWRLLEDHLVVHGFDALKEAIETLRAYNKGNPRRVYHWLAAGSADEDRTFYFNAVDPCSSSFYQQGSDRFGLAGRRIEQPRPVQVRRLDTLLADGTIPAADFLKVDVEGFEKDVFSGSAVMLRSVLGIETETNFGISPTYPKGHFCTLHEILSTARLRVFDLNFNRVPRHSYCETLARTGRAGLEDTGKPATFNVLFCRDLIEEADHPENYQCPCGPVNVDQIIKAMIIYELHGLSDIALDTAVRFRDVLAERLDVDKAINLLADPLCRVSGHRQRVLEKLRRRIFWASRARFPGALQGCSRLFGGLRLGSSRRA